MFHAVWTLWLLELDFSYLVDITPSELYTSCLLDIRPSGPWTVMHQCVLSK